MASLNDSNATTSTKDETIIRLAGNDGTLMDVVEDAGQNKGLVLANVTVDQILGRNPKASNHFAIGTFADCQSAMAENDTLRLEITVGCDATLFPAVDFTYTVTAGDVAATEPELSVRNNFISGINADSDFGKSWIAETIEDNGIVYVESLFFSEKGERIGADQFIVSTTGTITAIRAFSDIKSRNILTRVDPDPSDKRLGRLTGDFNITPGDLNAGDNPFAKNGGSNDLLVDGSSTPVSFTVPAPTAPTESFHVTQMRFTAAANGIKYGQFLSIAILATGIELNIISEGVSRTPFENFLMTDNLSYFDGTGRAIIEKQAGRDFYVVALIFQNPFKLITDSADEIEIIINDDLTASSLKLFTFRAYGFFRK